MSLSLVSTQNYLKQVIRQDQSCTSKFISITRYQDCGWCGSIRILVHSYKFSQPQKEVQILEPIGMLVYVLAG